MIFNAKYTLVFNNMNIVRRDCDACFRNIFQVHRPDLKYVVYHLQLIKNYPLEKAQRYLDIVRNVFGFKDIITTETLRPNQEGSEEHDVVVKVEGFSDKSLLLALSMVRYIKEKQNVLELFFKYLDKYNCSPQVAFVMAHIKVPFDQYHEGHGVFYRSGIHQKDVHFTNNIKKILADKVTYAKRCQEPPGFQRYLTYANSVGFEMRDKIHKNFNSSLSMATEVELLETLNKEFENVA